MAKADRNFPPTALVANDRARGTAAEFRIVSDVVSPGADVWIPVGTV